MYHVIIYSREHGARPLLHTPKNVEELLPLIWNAGRRQQDIIVQEFSISDEYGDAMTVLWESPKGKDAA